MAIEVKDELAVEPAEDWRSTCTFTLVMRSAFGSAVAVVPGFPSKASAERAARAAQGHPNVDEWGEDREHEVVSAAAAHQARWVDIVILPVPRA